jgi:hypothetical protein
MKPSSAKANNSSKSNKVKINIAYSTGPRIDPYTVPRSRSKNIEFEPSMLT